MKTLSERLRNHAFALTNMAFLDLTTEAADALDELVGALERSIRYLEDEGWTDEFTVMLGLKAVLAKHKGGAGK